MIEFAESMEDWKEYLERELKEEKPDPKAEQKKELLRKLQAKRGETRFEIPDKDEQTKPRTYVIQGDGIWLMERQRIGTITTHVTEQTLPGLSSEMEEGFQLALPKIPHNLFAQIVSFFRHICKSMNEAEAYAIIYWDTEEERYFVEVPKHTVSKGSVKYERDIKKDADPRYILAMEIHSHNTMSGYFSGTDTADEKAFRMYGVVGRVDKTLPEWSLRVVSSANGKEVPLTLDEIFTISEEKLKALKSVPSVVFPTKEWTSKIEAVTRRPAKVVTLSNSRGNSLPFDSAKFGVAGAQLFFPGTEPLLPRAEERLEKVRAHFGADQVQYWARFGISKEEKERIWSFGEDPEDIESLLRYGGLDVDERVDLLEDPHEWFYGESSDLYTYADSVVALLDSESLVTFIGRILANGCEEEVEEAWNNFRGDPAGFGNPFEDTYGTKDNSFG